MDPFINNSLNMLEPFLPTPRTPRGCMEHVKKERREHKDLSIHAFSSWPYELAEGVYIAPTPLLLLTTLPITFLIPYSILINI